MNKAIVVASVLLAVAVVSCKKDDDDEAMTTAEIVSSTTWNIDTIGFDMDKNGSIDQAAPGLEACELDNTFTFSADSTGVFDEGATKCDAADPQNTPFEWQLSADEKKMTIAGEFSGELDQVNGDVDVLAASRDSLVLSKLISVTFPIPFSGNLILKLKK